MITQPAKDPPQNTTLLLSETTELQELINRLPRPAKGRRTLLGLVGEPGAGKSTVAAAIATLNPAAYSLVPMDGFHLANQVLRTLGFLDRKGAPETFDAHGYAALLARLRVHPDETVYAPSFQRDLEQPLANALPIAPSSSLLITEGNYLLLDGPGWRHARHQLDEIWYVRVDPEIRRERLIARHTLFGKTPAAAKEWVRRIDDPNAALVAATRDRADRILDTSDWDTSGWKAT
ncbi:nucleoside/nucleotide kinase family protein [Arthrobacter tumbae]|uniref:nucleoside/nucleotide kinase family protein n=1 Tax=Arthrobacter tumbae TaxID=163874 RepID=UPI00195895FF|nr:nucleoside/nucleotide kinase family protein [Arthrobacter tumbae]MBM7781907.1 pantothenate kinase [Arthrobacter tumbae]